MNTDKRVEVLEQEIALLKAQIQTVLLDIQEQLLTNAYPSLRAEDITPPTPSNSTPDNPNVRKVSADNFQTNTPIGNGRTQQAQRFDPGSRDNLTDDPDQTRWQNPMRQMRLTEDPDDFQNEEDNFPVVRNVAKSPHASVQHYAARPAPQPARQTEVQPPPSRPAAPPKKAAPTESRLSQAAKTKTQAVATTPATVPASSGKHVAKPKGQTKSAPKAGQTPKTNSKKQPESSDAEPQKSNMVLRLIAGVQNAGAGISRKKSNYG